MCESIQRLLCHDPDFFLFLKKDKTMDTFFPKVTLQINIKVGKEIIQKQNYIKS